MTCIQLLFPIVVLIASDVQGSQTKDDATVSLFQWQDGGKVRWAKNCDYESFTLDWVNTTSDKCGDACVAKPPCTHFSRNEERGNTCRLMGEQGDWTEKDIFTPKDPNAFCGYVVKRNLAIQWTFNGKYQWANDCDYKDVNDFVSKATWGKNECGDFCQKRNQCTHFTWTEENGCELKTGQKQDIFIDRAFKTDYTSVCGFKTKSEQST